MAIQTYIILLWDITAMLYPVVLDDVLFVLLYLFYTEPDHESIKSYIKHLYVYKMRLYNYIIINNRYNINDRIRTNVGPILMNN